MGARPIAGDVETDGEEIVAEINVTPLTDIFLVLLIIFMVTSSVIVEEGKNIDLPDASVAEDTTPKGVIVSISAEGEIRVNDVVAEAGTVLRLLEIAIEEAEDKIVILRGDASVALGRAVNILDLAQQAGAKGIAISTEQPPAALEIQQRE
ncbi:MAG: biopolymer transporter ExbD [Deltaproteobacteria bacterium]|nr:biopolymer transporter ExbD [Deltaproteobacteria bacterium]MBW2291934.1 biopolymer transporter ExbD [Deltaproteobacteria bacterium]MBW2391436.1 biopolymer transporter ExbD [Deltaproteobacteria bacterium]MBW2723920.1 biopolymer transporter ExbD [Deltaproteobacteria bacterium]